MPGEESSTAETIGLIFRALRYLLVAFNSIVILFVLYFLFSGQNLGGEKLMMSTWLRVVLSLLVALTAVYGIVVALWSGKKCKFHLRLIAGYLMAIAILSFIAIILASIYVRKTNKYDVIFIVVTCILVFFLTSLATGKSESRWVLMFDNYLINFCVPWQHLGMH